MPARHTPIKMESSGQTYPGTRPVAINHAQAAMIAALNGSQSTRDRAGSKACAGNSGRSSRA